MNQFGGSVGGRIKERQSVLLLVRSATGRAAASMRLRAVPGQAVKNLSGRTVVLGTTTACSAHDGPDPCVSRGRYVPHRARPVRYDSASASNIVNEDTEALRLDFKLTENTRRIFGSSAIRASTVSPTASRWRIIIRQTPQNGIVALQSAVRHKSLQRIQVWLQQRATRESMARLRRPAAVDLPRTSRSIWPASVAGFSLPGQELTRVSQFPAAGAREQPRTARATLHALFAIGHRRICPGPKGAHSFKVGGELRFITIYTDRRRYHLHLGEHRQLPDAIRSSQRSSLETCRSRRRSFYSLHSWVRPRQSRITTLVTLRMSGR